MNRLLVQLCLLKAILVRAQKEEKTWKESFLHLREYISNHEQNVGRNMDINGHSGEVSDKNEEHVIGN